MAFLFPAAQVTLTVYALLHYACVEVLLSYVLVLQTKVAPSKFLSLGGKRLMPFHQRRRCNYVAGPSNLLAYSGLVMLGPI